MTDDPAGEVMSPTAAIADRLRSIRQGRPYLQTQENVAALMRSRVGIDWRRSTVAAVETGRRTVSIEEWIGLCIVCDLKPHEWFPDAAGSLLRLSDDWTTAEVQAVTPRFMRAMLGSGEGADEHDYVTWGDLRGQAAENPEPVVRTLVHRLQDGLLPGTPPIKDPVQATRDANAQAETKAAERLGLQPLTVAVLAHHLWGRSIEEERDARLGQELEDAPARTVQAKRGQMTRKLDAELRELIEEHDLHGREQAARKGER